MGYTQGEILNEFDHQDLALQQKWRDMLSERSKSLFGFVLPHKKNSSLACAFLEMPPVDQMYVCGLLSPLQYLEMSMVSASYMEECQHIIQQNYKDVEQEEALQSLLSPTIYEIRPRLVHVAFHDAIMDKFVEVVEKIKWASIISDLNSFNYEGRMFNFNDEQEVYDILEPKDEFMSDIKALEACLLVRNGCTVVPKEYDVYLGYAVDYFCKEATSCLLSVPENEWTKGSSKRGKLAHQMFVDVFSSRGPSFHGKKEVMMASILKRTLDLLGHQAHFDEDWQKYLKGWFGTLMRPYAKTLAERFARPQKLTEQLLQILPKDKEQERHK